MEQYSLFITYSILFILAGIFSVLINGLFLKFSKTLGIRNQTDTIIRWGNTSKPAFGGISFYIVFLLALAANSILLDTGGLLYNIQLLGVILATTLGFLLGLSDDAYNTRPILKFITQVACGIILILTGTHISLFQNIYLDGFITIIWVVGIMNSINMLDNMDAITTLVSFMILFTVLMILFISHQLLSIYGIICIGVCGALIGFLFYNWHPSKMYMGDTGSQFLGVLLSALSIKFFWNFKTGNDLLVVSEQIIVTMLAFIIPITDTATVIINRISKGKSPFIGGKDHTTHNLFYNGITEKRIALLFTFISGISMAFIYVIYTYLTEWTHLYTILFLIYFFLVFGPLFYLTRRKR